MIVNGIHVTFSELDALELEREIANLHSKHGNQAVRWDDLYPSLTKLYRALSVNHRAAGKEEEG